MDLKSEKLFNVKSLIGSSVPATEIKTSPSKAIKQNKKKHFQEISS